MLRKIANALILSTVALAAGAVTASAGQECRQYLPAAGVTIAVPCAEAVAETTEARPVPVKTALAEPRKAAVAPAQKPTGNVSPATEAVKAAPAVAAPPAQTEHKAASKDTAGEGNLLKQCVAILERAQLGRLNPGDVKMLRESCRTAG